MDRVGADTDGAIAIIGMGCRFPGAAGVEEFWELLEGNTDAVRPVPADRFDASAWYAAEAATPGKLISRHGGFIDDLYAFDAAFFGISPREALTMDPQQRILLQVVWEALEAAGILPSSLAGSATGVFVGQATAEYADAAGPSGAADVRAMAGSRLRSITSGRVSYALDLRGPSLVLDTACSSSLVALHTARQSLATGECDLAIAAGVNAVLSPVDAIAYSQGKMLAPDGRCKFGDGSADGFVRSEGVGAVLLKRLPDALADGDPVLALLLGSAVTNDGKGSGLLLKPAVSGQAEMLRAAWRNAGVTPSQVDYVEAHGTGTTVGDGVELQALAEALGADVAAEQPLLVGSVKTNIGHAEAAAGMAGLIKTVLLLQHRTIPASLHLASPHPLLADGGLPLRVVSRNTALVPRGDRAVLGVSSFGLSGTNAHAVIGEYAPQAARSETSPSPTRRPRTTGEHISWCSVPVPRGPCGGWPPGSPSTWRRAAGGGARACATSATPLPPGGRRSRSGCGRSAPPTRSWQQCCAPSRWQVRLPTARSTRPAAVSGVRWPSSFRGRGRSGAGWVVSSWRPLRAFGPRWLGVTLPCGRNSAGRSWSCWRTTARRCPTRSTWCSRCCGRWRWHSPRTGEAWGSNRTCASATAWARRRRPAWPEHSPSVTRPG